MTYDGKSVSVGMTQSWSKRGINARARVRLYYSPVQKRGIIEKDHFYILFKLNLKDF